MSETNRKAPIARVAAAIAMLGIAAGALSACNTMSGVGKDVSSAGSAVTGTSEATQQKLPDTPKPAQ